MRKKIETGSDVSTPKTLMGKAFGKRLFELESRRRKITLRRILGKC
jgi:hypothetical protein